MKRLLLSLLLAWSASAACIPPPNTYDWEAESWRVAVQSVGETLSGAAYRAGTVYCQQAKWWGVRPYLGRVNLFVGNNLTAMSIPIISDWRDIVGGFQPDDFPNFVGGDFSEATGLTGNGTTKYMRMNGATFPLNLNSTRLNVGQVKTNLHLATYVRTGSNQESFIMGVQANFSSPMFHLIVSQSANLSASEMGSSVTTLFGDTNGVGFYVSTRRSATDIAIYKNGVQRASDTTFDSAEIPDLPFVIYALKQQGSAFCCFNSRTLSYSGIGYGMPDALNKPYYDIVQNVQITMGRAK